MKVIKINAIWCSACLVMNNNWNKVLKDKDIETISLDYDVDDIDEYNVGDVLPVFIFYKDDKDIISPAEELQIQEHFDDAGQLFLIAQNILDTEHPNSLSGSPKSSPCSI